jgi:hypothetical protein
MVSARGVNAGAEEKAVLAGGGIGSCGLSYSVALVWSSAVAQR